MSTVDDYRKQFLQIIQRRQFDSDRFIDLAEQADVIRDCLEAGIPEDGAQSVLLELCKARNWTLESEVRKYVSMALRKGLSDDGRIDEDEFNQAVAVAKQACEGRRDEAACKRMVIDLMERGEAPVKTGLFGGWYKKVRKEVGLA